mmetsp:Transcript_16171/g.31623  ORF Transcript_16171/g.31623 Transcript_16171/m.31623 type:complete len:472 (+) Transcript_16171:52-1467(+)
MRRSLAKQRTVADKGGLINGQRTSKRKSRVETEANLRAAADVIEQYGIASGPRLQENTGDDFLQQRREHRFTLFIGAVIVANIILIALETDWGNTDAPIQDRLGWVIVDCIFTLIFITEIIVRMHWERWQWVRSPWNWFDVAIVLSAVIDVWILSFYTGKEGLQVLTILRVARLVRLVRMVKLIRALQGLYVMVMAFWHAMKAMCFICLMMLFGVLLYGVFGTLMIGRNSAFDGVKIYDDTVYDRFGTVYRSMYSLFELMTLEGWDQVARPLVLAQPLTIVFIASFIMIFTFGMLNMIVALVVEKTLEQTRQMGELQESQLKQKMCLELQEIVRVFNHSDEDGDGSLTLAELEEALSNSEVVRTSVAKMGVPTEDISELYRVLDWSHSGAVKMKEFVEGIIKMQAELPSSRDAVATRCNVKSLIFKTTRLNACTKVMEEHAHRQDDVLQDVLNGLRNLQLDRCATAQRQCK